ncbi:tetratricopeptide repeat protein [Agromyces sp. NPDC004153]
MQDWQQRVDAVWDAAGELGGDEVVRRIDALAAELPDDDPRAPFEQGGARDSAGLEAEAEPFYRRALDLGLDGRPRVELHVQLASTLRNLGRPQEAIALLDAIEPESGDLRDAVIGFRALARVDAGDARLAASEAVAALAVHVTQYRRALGAYARDLAESAGESRDGAASA